MVREPEEIDSEIQTEDEGGPVKPFLEHLEDLRWTLIKSIVAILLAMLVCMIAGNFLVRLLTWPLEHSLFQRADTNQVVALEFGTNVIARAPLSEFGMVPNATNRIVGLKLVPITFGSNIILGLVPQTVTPGIAAASPAKMVILKNYTPLGAIFVVLKLALYGGLVLASPFVFYFVGQFVLPALKVNEKKILYQAVGFGTGLFLIGVVFCYFIVVGVALGASVQFSQWLGFGADEWRAEDYIGFVCKFMLGMGLAFELPVVILVLVKIGLLDYERLSKFRTYAIVGNLIISAFATPSGDPFTMFLMALPLQFLYEVSVAVAKYWERRDRKREAAEQAAGTDLPA